MIFKFLHEVTKNTDGFTHRHFFRIEKRIKQAFIVNVRLMKDGKEIFSFKGKVESLSNDDFKRFEKDNFFGNIHFDAPLEVDLPDSYEFTFKYGALGQSTSKLTVPSSGKVEFVLAQAQAFMDKFNEEIEEQKKKEGK